MTEIRKAANRMSFGDVMFIFILHCTVKLRVFICVVHNRKQCDFCNVGDSFRNIVIFM